MFGDSVVINLRKLMFRAMPELAFNVLRMGEVVGIADPLPAEQGTDRFRPRYAVDVRLLTIKGLPDPDQPVMEGLPLPAAICGDGRGLYGFPDPGTRVLIAWAFASPAWPMIVALYPQGRAIPQLAPTDILIQQQFGSFLRFDAKGRITLQTDGELSEDSHARTVRAGPVSEELGSVTRAVDGGVTETIQGSLDQTVLGALIQKIGGDARAAILGSEDRTIAGDKQELAAGFINLVAGTDATLQATLGDVLIEAVVGSAEVKAAVQNKLTSALVDIGVSPTDAMLLSSVLLVWLDTHTHTSSAPGVATSPPIAPASVVPGIVSTVVKTT